MMNKDVYKARDDDDDDDDHDDVLALTEQMTNLSCTDNEAKYILRTHTHYTVPFTQKLLRAATTTLGCACNACFECQRCYFVNNSLWKWQPVELTETWFGVDIGCRREPCNLYVSLIKLTTITKASDLNQIKRISKLQFKPRLNRRSNRQ